MLVRLQKSKNNNNEWDVICLSSEFHGLKVASAEGVRLSEPRFQSNSITGSLAALQGATIEDFAYEDAGIIRALGIYGVFHKCHRVALHDEYNTGWFDSETGESLKTARFVNVMGSNIFYSSEEDVKGDRRNQLNKGLDESVEMPQRDLSAVEHFKEGFKKLKQTLKGG